MKSHISEAACGFIHFKTLTSLVDTDEFLINAENEERPNQKTFHIFHALDIAARRKKEFFLFIHQGDIKHKYELVNVADVIQREIK